MLAVLASGLNGLGGLGGGTSFGGVSCTKGLSGRRLRHSRGSTQNWPPSLGTTPGGGPSQPSFTCAFVFAAMPTGFADRLVAGAAAAGTAAASAAAAAAPFLPPVVPFSVVLPRLLPPFFASLASLARFFLSSSARRSNRSRVRVRGVGGRAAFVAASASAAAATSALTRATSAASASERACSSGESGLGCAHTSIVAIHASAARAASRAAALACSKPDACTKPELSIWAAPPLAALAALAAVLGT